MDATPALAALIERQEAIVAHVPAVMLARTPGERREAVRRYEAAIADHHAVLAAMRREGRHGGAGAGVEP